MRAYRTIRLTECPDVADIRAEGRRSRVGRLDAKSYCRPAQKRKIRRTLKRRDKSRCDSE